MTFPPYEGPPSRFPKDRIPTPTEFVEEAIRRRMWVPEAAVKAEAVVELLCMVRDWHPSDPEHREVLEQVRMAALLQQLVEERYDVWTEHADSVIARAYLGAPPSADQLLAQIGQPVTVLTDVEPSTGSVLKGMGYRCQASLDGDVCLWTSCPQKLDREPEKSGRSCPLPEVPL